MTEQKDFLIKYGDNQINMFSDERNDYVSLTDIYKAWNKYSKSLNAWLKTKQTLEFLDAWEKKHNPNYKATHLSQAIKLARERNGLSAQAWIELTNAKGIFTRGGANGGTYAHKDIAIRFTGWLSPEFELFLVEEIQRLKKIEEQKNSYELLTHKQVLFLIQLKEVFKYVAHQIKAEEAHKEVFAAKSGAKNPFVEFHKWRNKILDLSPEVINTRIEEYCKENNIPLTKKLLKKSKREKLLLLDSYEAVRNAVWDFLSIKGEMNAFNLANLVKDMIRTEKGEVLFENENDLFHTKQDLGEFNDVNKKIGEMPIVKTAREVLALREANKKELSPFDKTLKSVLSVPAPKMEDKK